MQDCSFCWEHIRSIWTTPFYLQDRAEELGISLTEDQLEEFERLYEEREHD